MDLLDLPIDILYTIAANDITTWTTLAIYSPTFYSFTTQNVPLFVELFTIVTHKFSKSKWTLFGKKHRLNDLPAVICNIREIYEWWINGQLHRDNDLPAIWRKDEQLWYQYGQLHRDNDLPAHINNYSKQWYECGKLHRDNDLPAHISLDGTKLWYQIEFQHMENDLPACITSDDDMQFWYYNGVKHRDIQPGHWFIQPARRVSGLRDIYYVNGEEIKHPYLYSIMKLCYYVLGY